MGNKNTHFFATIVRIIIIVLSFICILGFFLISPYKEWDASLKIVDYDVVDVEKIALLFMSTVNIAISLLSGKVHRAFAIVHMLLAVVFFLQFLWLLTL